MMDGHKMMFKAKTLNDKKNTMSVYLQCRFWRTISNREGYKSTLTQYFDFAGQEIGESPGKSWKMNDKPHSCDVKFGAMLDVMTGETISAKEQMRLRAVEMALSVEHVLAKPSFVATLVHEEFVIKYHGAFFCFLLSQ